MQSIEEHILTDSTDSMRFGAQSADFLNDSESVQEEVVEERSDHTDDPVRVYLREMGSVRLLTKQAEIDLARRMERGILRIQKALSRSALVRKRALAIQEDIRSGKVRAEDHLSMGGADD